MVAQRAVTTAGTPEKVKESPEYVKNKVIAVMFRANRDNAGNIYVTDNENRASASTVSLILAAGETMVLDVSKFFDGYINLAELWIDAANSGDGLSYIAFEVVK